MAGSNSRRWFDRALGVIPGGVNSPVRAFGAVGGTPVFFRRGEGAFLWDEDDRAYLDFVSCWGALILGHGAEAPRRALREAVQQGVHFGTATRWEVEFAEHLCRAVPGLDRVRLVNSGTEATMSALRLARAATGREKVVKFSGCYHGHVDSLLVEAGSGVATMSIPGTPGVTRGNVADTWILPYNDVDALERLFAERGEEVAAVIVEPVAGNMGCVPPVPGFLPRLREVTRARGALLIFDEVITGFRLGPGGAQARYGITPDLTCLGKIIGGGLPIGAYGGRADLMREVAPEGPVYQAGTLSGNPLAVRAGTAVLEALETHPPYEELERQTSALAGGLEEIFREAGVPHRVQRAGSMLTLFFTGGPVRDFQDARETDTRRFRRFFHAMLERGVYLPPSGFECWFVTAAHGAGEIDRALEAARGAAKNIAGEE